MLHASANQIQLFLKLLPWQYSTFKLGPKNLDSDDIAAAFFPH